MPDVFVCQVVPKDLTSKLIVSQAANNFCFNLIDSNCFDRVVSLVPINVVYSIIDTSSEISYIQTRLFKNHTGLFKLLNSIIESFKLSNRVKKCSKIWFYNITPHNFLSSIILNIFYKKSIFLILADFTPPNSKLSFQYLIKIFIEKRVSGIISLSSRNTFQHNNMSNLAGIIPANKVINIKNNFSSKRDFLLSGRLEESTGVTMAIEVFSLLPDCQLLITGNLNDEVVDLIAQYDNITYLGLLNYEDYLKILCSIPFVLNFRNPSFNKNLNNFPSKILEAFSVNRVVISTFEYEELEGFKYFHCPYEKESILNIIKELKEMPFSDLEGFAQHSQLLINTFSEDAWKSLLLKIENY